MVRRGIALVSALIMTLGLAPSAAAQNEAEQEGSAMALIVLCMTITRAASDAALTPDSFKASLATGEATIDEISEPVACAGSSEIGPGVPDSADLGPGETDPDDAATHQVADVPFPVDVIETYMTKRGDNVNYLIIVENPNPEVWAASMWIRVDALDKKDGRTGFAYDRLFLMPGQKTALSGYISGAQGTKRVDVILAEHPSSYVTDIPSDADVRLTKVKTKTKKFEGPKTSGVIEGMPADVIGVWLQAVYRNKKGRINGIGSTYLPGTPADGTKFETVGQADGKIAETELYYQIIR